jgi:hypothetical protein
MRIVNYESNESFDDIETLTITIKAVPFEGTYVPAFMITAPSDDYQITLDEMHCMMDGVEIANRKIDDIINFILMTKAFGDEDK